MRLDPLRGRDLAAPHPVQHRLVVACFDRRLTGQQRVQRRPQPVDVACGTQLVDVPGGLLRAHVRRRAQHRAGPRHRPFVNGARRQQRTVAAGRLVPFRKGLGQSPVDDQRLTVLAEHDVARFEIAVQHALAVSEAHCLTDVRETPQQLAERQSPLAGIAAGDVGGVKPFHRGLEVVPLDETHGIERPAVGVRTQPIDRHDAGMLQSAGDLRLQQKPAAADCVVRVTGLDPLERHLAVELLIPGHEHFA